jgi:hypothetical protein
MTHSFPNGLVGPASASSFSQLEPFCLRDFAADLKPDASLKPERCAVCAYFVRWLPTDERGNVTSLNLALGETDKTTGARTVGIWQVQEPPNMSDR